MAVRFVVLALVPVALLGDMLRTLVVLASRRRAPRVASFVDRWWAWFPLAVVLVLLTIAEPVIGILAIAGSYLFLTRSRAIGSPFRPRR